MRTKSFPARSWHKSSRKSLDPYPSPSPLPEEEANERFGSGVNEKLTAHCDSDDGNVEMVPDTFDESHVPHKKRHFREISETDKERFEPVNLDACIVCEVFDKWVSHCSGIDCLVSFHAECLKAELGCGEDLANSYCPYCWFKILALKSKSLREKAVGAEKAVFKHLDKEMEVKESVPKTQEDPNLADDENGNQQDSGDCTDILSDQELEGEKDEYSSHVQVEKDSGKSRDEDMASIEETDQSEKDKGKLEESTGKSRDITEEKMLDRAEASENEERENFEDAEVDKDGEAGKHQTKVDTGTVKETDDSLISGKEHKQGQQNEKPRRRRRLIKLSAVDSDISSNESTNEQNGENVTEQLTSSTQVISPSRMMKKQQRKPSATTTKVAKSNTVRDISFIKKDQRRRLYWTFEEEEMLKVGVEKFAAEAKRNMPWRKILEMGEKVFHETRTPADLKDKWRNLQKANKTDH